MWHTQSAETQYVPANERDQLRLALAGDGLPESGSTGYEILDDLSGFGTTSKMFDVAYWRALEGELSRTIVSSPPFQSARVHIGRSAGSSLKKVQPQTASVTASASSGVLTPGQAKALKFLVGSAVSGLSPEMVSVIDGNTGKVFSKADQDAFNTCL